MKNRAQHLLLLALLLVIGITAQAAPVRDKAPAVDTNALIAHTPLGKLRGAKVKEVYVWKGIRYAQAPVGDMRFKAPVPVKAWTGTQDALTFGAVAPQQESSIAGKEPQSEDCLYLNVWSPGADAKKRPVMVWLHGGGFIIGSGSSQMYEGTQMATNGDVVIVTINYRLGPLGFLYFNDEQRKQGFENNLGIKDQMAALEWVQQNIAAFGGDPAQVTIFGESAGGTSVQTLLASPMAKGLFSKAIVQSGPAGIIWKPQSATVITEKYMSLLGLKPTELAKLKTIPTDTLVAAEEKLVDYMVSELNDKVFCPTVDGEVLPHDLFTCVKNSGNIPLLIGTNLNESSIFASNALKMMPKDAKGFEQYFATVNPDSALRKKVTASYPAYPRKRAVLNLLTDAVFRIPAIRLAECHLSHAPVYMYRFEWSSPSLNMIGLRSFHGLEIPFVFGAIDEGRGKLLKIIATKRTRTRMIGQIQGAWLNFAKYGNPNGKDGTGGLGWQPYTTTNRHTMIFNKKTKQLSDPNATERQAWDGVVYY